MSGSTRQAAARFIFVTIFLDILGIGVIIPVLPGLVTDMVGGDPTLGARWYGPLSASYALMQFLFAPLLGSLSDRYGRRPVLLLSLTGFGLNYILLGLAPSLPWLFAGRILAGITGASITTASAYLADISTRETRAKNFGLIGAAFGLGFILGPALGGLMGHFGARVPFFASAALVLLNVLYGVFVLPESLPPERRRPLALSDASPLSTLSRLRGYPLVSGLAVALVFFALAQRGLESMWVLYTEHRYGWEELENGLSLGLVGVMAALVQGGLIRRIVPRLGERRAILTGLSIATVAFVLYGLAPSGGLLLAIIPLSALGAIAQPTLQGVIAGVVPDSEQGGVQGALTSLMSLTAVFAPLISTTLFARFTDDLGPTVPGAPFFAGSVFLACALGVSAFVLRHGIPVQDAPG